MATVDPRYNWSPCYRIAHGWNNWVQNNLQSTCSLMKLKEPRSFSSSFILFFFFSLFLFFSFFLFAPQNHWQHNALTPPPPPCLNVCLSSSNEVMITWWSECTKPLSILWTQLWNSREHLLVKDWSQQRRKRGRPAGLLSVGLQFFGFFFCELFDASQAYVLLNFALDSTVLPSK